MPQIRTFIAVELPEAIKRELARLQSDLRRYGARVSWTRPEGLHVTLKFLGNVDERQIEAIAEAVKTAVAGEKQPRLTVVGTGAFPSWGSPRVLWVGVEDEKNRLAEIQARLDKELEKLGFEREKRAFKPHLTLGRVKAIGGVRPVCEDLRNREVALGTFEVAEIVVMKSDLKPTGAVYTPLAKISID